MARVLKGLKVVEMTNSVSCTGLASILNLLFQSLLRLASPKWNGGIASGSKCAESACLSYGLIILPLTSYLFANLRALGYCVLYGFIYYTHTRARASSSNSRRAHRRGGHAHVMCIGLHISQVYQTVNHRSRIRYLSKKNSRILTNFPEIKNP